MLTACFFFFLKEKEKKKEKEIVGSVEVKLTFLFDPGKINKGYM